MPDDNISLYAHPIRRAGFGARRDQLEGYAARPYEDVVDELVNPESVRGVEEEVLDRYYDMPGKRGAISMWVYRMLNSERQLQEKMALFWHHVLATGTAKFDFSHVSVDQIDMFRRSGLSNVRNILIEVSKNPAMIMWLDNNENHKDQPNENYGRELLELFSMGVGNYTEGDVKAATEAFTGWTFTQPLPPPGSFSSSFDYRGDDHDDGAKVFLGETGRFNGEDVIDIIVKQPAAARFIARHLYTFFVADEPDVASWNETPPRDPVAIDTLVASYLASGGEIRPVLSTLFNAKFFKEARFSRVKSPIELVLSVMKLAGIYAYPDPGIGNYYAQAGLMGQQLLNPLTVEGWHTGSAWIDGGTLNSRVNFAADQVGDAANPGIREIIERLKPNRGSLEPHEFVDRCLDLVGPLSVDDDTRGSLLEHAEADGPLNFEKEIGRSKTRVVKMLQLIVATREFQFN